MLPTYYAERMLAHAVILNDGEVPAYNDDLWTLAQAIVELENEIQGQPAGHCLCACNRAWIPSEFANAGFFPRDCGHGFEDCDR